MSTTSPNKLTPKQIAKYQRQKCINLLEKMMRNLFRMFRNTDMKQSDIEERFNVLYKQITDLKKVELYSNYHREMRVYIDEVATMMNSDRDVREQRESQMTRLNRIQKIKNISKYKKEKHQ